MIVPFSIVKQEVPMTQERISPLRQRMIEDMRIKGMGDKAQKAHIRALKDFTTFLDRSPDTATPDDLRAYQLHMADAGVTPSTYNARIVALRFFFSMTCGREEMKRFLQFRREPRKLPIVLSIEEISALLAAAPVPGLKYRAALSIGYGGGLLASEVTHLKVRDIDSDRMLIHVEQGKGGKDRDVMLSPSLLDLLRNYWREARPQGWLFLGQSRVDPISSRQLIRHEIHRPSHVGRVRHRQRVGLVPFQPFARFDPQVQFQFAIDAVNAFMVPCVPLDVAQMQDT